MVATLGWGNDEDNFIQRIDTVAGTLIVLRKKTFSNYTSQRII
jgi:hypothetical protein